MKRFAITLLAAISFSSLANDPETYTCKDLATEKDLYTAMVMVNDVSAVVKEEDIFKSVLKEMHDIRAADDDRVKLFRYRALHETLMILCSRTSDKPLKDAFSFRPKVGN